MGGVDYTARTQTTPPESVDALENEIIAGINNAGQAGALTADQQGRIRGNEAAIRMQLRLWIVDPAGQVRPGGKGHPIYGRKRQDRHYANMADLAIALLGWVEAKQGRRDEKALAHQAAADATVGLLLDNVLARIHMKIHYLHGLDLTAPLQPVDQARRDEIVQELTTGTAQIPVVGGGVQATDIGHYRHYMEGVAARPGAVPVTFGGNFMQVLMSPERFSIWEKMIVLHDLMEYFGDARPWVTKSKGEGQLPPVGAASPEARSTTAIDAAGQRTAFTNDRGFVPGHPSTRNESEASTRFARDLRIPIWAGASMTTVRMLNLGRWAGASTSELGAVAWGIFSFWRLAYDHTAALAYHTLHEVMDMAQNFGVAYNVLDRGGGLRALDLGGVARDVQATWQKLRGDAVTLDGHVRGAGPVGEPIKAYLARIDTLLRDSNAVWQGLRGKDQGTTVQGLRSIARMLAEGVRVYNLVWMSVDQRIRDIILLPPYEDSDDEEP